MKRTLALGFCLSTLAGVNGLIHADAPSADWQKVRDKQPAALHVQLTLPKDHFFQGEEIDAILDFTNDDAATKYTIEGVDKPWTTLFHAVDAQGVAAVNPLGWYYNWYGIVSTGPVQMAVLGQYSGTFPVNECVRFDHPGVYRLYAQIDATTGSDIVKAGPRVEMVSDPVTLTIVPRTPADEKAAISHALGTMAGVLTPRDKMGSRSSLALMNCLICKHRLRWTR